MLKSERGNGNTIQTDIVIVGSGFGGIGMGIKLAETGRRNFLILEKANDLGGAWRDNSYPGCACDIPSYLYSYSFEHNSKWSRVFAPYNEIHEYIRECASKHSVEDHIRYNSCVVEMCYNDAAARWTIKLDDGVLIDARIVISAMGGLSIPSIPTLEGIETFKGEAFHSAEWDHSVDYRNKCVAVVGTGASAIQIVPTIQPDVASLSVFQRTPPWIMPKSDSEITPKQQAWVAKNQWAQELMRKALYVYLESTAIGMIWNPDMMEDMAKKGRKHIKDQIKDPELRTKVTPDFKVGCKRTLLSNDYYPALTQDNVNLVTDHISHVTETSIVTQSGTEHPVDIIVYCTGFRVTEPFVDVEVYGKGGRSIKDDWKNGAEGYYGVMASGYPNFFTIVGPNTGLGHNSMIYIIETHIRYISACLDWMAQDGLAEIDVDQKAQTRFNDRLQKRFEQTVWSTGCDSWYQTDGGKNTAIWPYFSFHLRDKLSRIRKQDFNRLRFEDVTAEPA